MARVRSIQIRTHRLVSEALQGAYRSNVRGTGIEFDTVRPYLVGDDVRTIDWKVTARTREPFIKTFVEERSLLLQIVVDTSLSMDFGSGEKTKREIAAEAAALLSFVASGEQDQVGLQLVADAPGLRLQPNKGTRHVLRVVREVVAAPARGNRSAIGAVLEEELRLLKRRSLLVLISDFLGLEEGSWERPLARLARRHDVIALRVFDPLEEELPSAGVILLTGLEEGGAVEVDTRSRAVRERWAAAARERNATLARVLRRAQVDSIDVSTRSDVAEPLVRLFRRRERGRWPGGGPR
jgi:uncharacterized protein (DUF58 family)